MLWKCDLECVLCQHHTKLTKLTKLHIEQKWWLLWSTSCAALCAEGTSKAAKMSAHCAWWPWRCSAVLDSLIQGSLHSTILLINGCRLWLPLIRWGSTWPGMMLTKYMFSCLYQSVTGESRHAIDIIPQDAFAPHSVMPSMLKKLTFRLNAYCPVVSLLSTQWDPSPSLIANEKPTSNTRQLSPWMMFSHWL